MKYTGAIKGSRTYDYGALLAIFGAVQVALPAVQESLNGWYGEIFLLTGALVAWLRYKTTGPVGVK